MSKLVAIIKKELGQYFKSPSAYIILIVTYSVFNVFFFVIINENREATLRDVFQVMEFMFIFFIPLLTMRIFSEEKANGTLEFLLTKPIRHITVVLGKYLGVLIFFSLIISVNFVYFLIIRGFSSIDSATFFVAFVGLLLEGALFIAIGLFASSLTKHQVLAAILTYAALFMLYFGLSFIQYTSGIVESIIRYGAVLSHSQNMTHGLVYCSDIAYFLCNIAIFICLTHRAIKRVHE